MWDVTKYTLFEQLKNTIPKGETFKVMNTILIGIQKLNWQNTNYR